MGERTDEELDDAYAHAFTETWDEDDGGDAAAVALRAVYNLGRADRDAELAQARAELAALKAELASELSKQAAYEKSEHFDWPSPWCPCADCLAAFPTGEATQPGGSGEGNDAEHE